VAVSFVLLVVETGDLEKTNNMPQVTDKLYRIMYGVHLTMSGIQTHSFSGEKIF
jgi:hypothetical protein